MTVRLATDMAHKMLSALMGDRIDDSPFLTMSGSAMMRFDQVVIEVQKPGEVRVSFHWRGKEVMYMDHILGVSDRATIVMEGAMHVRID